MGDRTHWNDCWKERTHHDCAVARIYERDARIAKLEAALRTISKATFICTKQLRDWECCTHEVQRVADAAIAKESER